MKSLILDFFGLSGFGLLSAGVYLQFGTAPAMMFAGALLLAGTLFAAARGQRDN